MSKFEWVKKVLIIGSGSIKIGEAGEFDYSGSQAIKALKEEGIEVVLINPNVATIQTDPKIADKVYLEPIRFEFVKRIIEKERPDGLLLGFGGQTALNVGVQLYENGVLEKYGVKVLGTPVESIELTEDRELFSERMKKIGVKVPKSANARSIHEALEAVEEIGYPVIVKPSYTLGGSGSGVARNEDELLKIVKRGLSLSMVGEVLIEEYLSKWKEVEYEVVRDYDGNCITVCNMENFDPMGVHTGDSIVVAPSQTLNDEEYHTLRKTAIKVVRNLGVVGECNIQYALDPKSCDYRVIEVNARLSRSSALASKATGYPLAYIAAKLAIGYRLPELKNRVTGITKAFFEPSLDYIVVKIPRWDFRKFPNASRRIGSQMKSVGEVMSIGRCFEEALQKAVRMLDIGKDGIACDETPYDDEELMDIIRNPTDERIFAIYHAIKRGVDVDRISELSGIDKFFLYKIKNIVEMERELGKLRGKIKCGDLNDGELRVKILRAKRLGFSDKQIGKIVGLREEDIRKLRKRLGIRPFVKRIDTMAAEWPAKTNYLYLTYWGDRDDVKRDEGKKKVIVLGSGVYRIGSSVEFDWCSVNTVLTLKDMGYEAIIVNYNPETVSTDYDMSDKLYFEEITLERVLDIYEFERPIGIIISVGGQIPNNLALPLSRNGVKILGTPARNVDMAEDREKFSKLLDEIGIAQPRWSKMTSLKDALEFSREIGYPVLIRPSYVLSGASMRVAYSPSQLVNYVKEATKVSKEHPVVISKFFRNSREVEVDGVCDGEDVFLGAIIEHVENAGVHSGDASMSIPPITLSDDVKEKIVDYSRKIATSLGIVGPFNIQYLVKDGKVYVIECNVRASRTMPYVSKTIGRNIIELSTRVILGEKLRNLVEDYGPYEPLFFGVKVPQFSHYKIEGTDFILGVEMASTGEVACFGRTFSEAYIKALLAAEFNVPIEGGNVLITVGGKTLKEKILPLARKLDEVGFNIYATEHTAEALIEGGVNAKVLYKVSEPERRPNIIDYIKEKKLDLIINIPETTTSEKYADMLEDSYKIRKKATEFRIPVITVLEQVEAIVGAIFDTIKRGREF
ncbi:MAG: carbamoyl-phosphate synthase (glutamine-hydrolyzing) large subunit, partial [Candidatus Asgardarchaeia archaeon]